jgi:hypothetical protein
VGLVVAEESQVGAEIVEWGRRAKLEVLTGEEAHAVATRVDVHLAGLTGDGGGVIGALAAAGLRRSGEDGRFLELGGLRAATGEQAAAVFIAAGVERFVSGAEEVDLAPEELISVGERHPQPVLRSGRPTLLLDPGSRRGGWRTAPRETVRRY